MTPVQACFFFSFAQGSFFKCVIPVLHVATGKADLSRVLGQMFRAPGQQDGGAIHMGNQGNKHGGTG